MRVLLCALLALGVITLTAPEPATAGNCDYSYQHAKNGSACGARASSALKASSYANWVICSILGGCADGCNGGSWAVTAKRSRDI